MRLADFQPLLTAEDDVVAHLLSGGVDRLGDGLRPAGPDPNRVVRAVFIAVIYVLFMFVAAGLKYVILVAVLYAPGTLLYFRSRREQNARIFNQWELVVFGIVVLGGIVGFAGLVVGFIKP